MVGEEAASAGRIPEFGKGPFWLVDPLDGTREFGEPGRHDWAVHIALWDRDHFVAGAVALPAVDLVLAGRIQLKPFVESHPLDDINRVFAAVHHREIKKRAVLVPA